MRLIPLLAIYAAMLPLSAMAQTAPATTYVNDNILPAVQPWHGADESLMQAQESDWATPFEQSSGMRSPSYGDTIAWLDKLMSDSSGLEKVSLGKSPQGRDIWMYIASDEDAKTPQQLKANHKPTVLVQAGIHGGEIDGKDAGMMLLRDIFQGEKRQLLEHVNLLFVPILNVDGHERSGEYNRVNQRGPVEMGWRSNSQNLNLNRDYAKADTLEIQDILGAINRWDPQLYIDVHVTDGLDYQYDITFGYNTAQGFSPNIYQWFSQRYRPQIEQALTAAGHTPGPLVFTVDNTDLSKGLEQWHPSQRYSDGYGDARHLPTVLIENHSLKPFKQRVLGTYVMLQQTLETVGAEATRLQAAIEKDRYRYPQLVTLTWEQQQQPLTQDFKGIDYTLAPSPISGAPVVRWNGEPKLYPQLPVFGATQEGQRVSRPAAYYIPPQWQTVIHRLMIHGIRMNTLEQPTKMSLQQYQLSEPAFSQSSFEGHQRVTAQAKLTKVTLTLPAGTMEVPTDQPLGDLAMMLLEPLSPDSFLQWGFFNTIFNRTEYIEDYAVEPMAAQMLATQPDLKKAFEAALKDAAFAADPKARLRWFYERSPYYDQQYLRYPVYRSR
ncbi:M14 family metallopeptidase [Shewanella yunxiaonensis]|uniref:M14 family metallopeptidase n=2 Tax=Shewanella yunxiaonensis TaxID=2829809 RepID=A0ABX7YTD7_9GAMM|nr:M14 family metallopeptidase [Shewanella yunxiaonensis]